MKALLYSKNRSSTCHLGNQERDIIIVVASTILSL